ncbi:MAG: CPBP family intramembrane glutamic endopeptidase [Candidatus Thorarchaeota archaeon]
MSSQKKSFKEKFGLIRGPVLLYFLLAIVITWIFWIPTIIIAIQNDYFLPGVYTFRDITVSGFRDEFHVVIFIINQIGVYGPFIAAIVVLWQSQGKKGINGLFKQITVWRVKPKWILILILVPFILALVPLAANLLYGADPSGAFNPGMSGLIILLTFVNNIFTSGLEEPGWRGYAFPELRKKDEAYRVSLIIGVFWSVWHYPYIFYLNLPTGMFLTIIAMFGFTVTIIGGSVIFSWIYANTKSLLILILFHAFQNVFPVLVMGQIVDMAGGVITGLFTWVLVFIILKFYGKKTLTGLTEAEIAAKEEKKKKD